MSTSPKSINVFVYNNCSKDARVLKEAESLTNAGFKVRIVAVLDNNTIPYEQRNGFEIFRIKRDSIHVKVIGAIRSIFNLFKHLIYFPFKIIYRLFKPLISKLAELILGSRNSYANESNELSKKDILYSLIKNPQRYSLSNYLDLFLFERYSLTRVLILFAGIVGFPIFIVAKFVFGIFESIIAAVSQLLMPYHRTSVFKDYYKKAALFCEEYPADGLHFHDLHTLPIIDYLKSPKSFKMVYDSHELYTEIHTLSKEQKKKYTEIERQKIKVVDHVITVNKSIARELVERYGIKEPSIVLNCPPMMKVVPEKTDRLRKAAGVSSNLPIVLYQGGYSTGRGLEELILAMKYVKSGVLVMMGWGPIEDDLKSLAASNKLMSKVKFIPPAEPHDLLNFTCGADLGMIPYRAIGLNNYYTSPNKLFEYIQAYVPVAGSNFPELKRFISEFEIGGFFDPEDPKDIGECIEKLIVDRDKLEKMRNNTMLAARTYNWENEGAKLVDIYKNLYQN